MAREVKGVQVCMGISGPRAIYVHKPQTQRYAPTRPFTIDCLWPVVLMGLYRNRGQVGHYMDLFWASLAQTFFMMPIPTLSYLSPFSLTITMGPRGVPVVNPDSAGLCLSAQNEESLPSGSHYSDHFPIDIISSDVGI